MNNEILKFYELFDFDPSEIEGFRELNIRIGGIFLHFDKPLSHDDMIKLILCHGFVKLFSVYVENEARTVLCYQINGIDKESTDV